MTHLDILRLTAILKILLLNPAISWASFIAQSIGKEAACNAGDHGSLPG